MKQSFIRFQYNTGTEGGGGNPVPQTTVAQTRAPQYKEIVIFEVRDYVSKTNGKTMFSFNNGAFHLSFAQLSAAGIEVPQLLQGTTMLVDFFQVGEALLNGTEVRDANRIVRQFVPQQDHDLLRDVAKDILKEKFSNWRKAALGTPVASTVAQPTAAPQAAPAMVAAPDLGTAAPVQE